LEATFTTKAKGMGFGLPICKLILKAHGGKIHVTSTEGKGSTFTLTLSVKEVKKREPFLCRKPLKLLLA
jgi:signal transduction histidine kinase